MKLKDFIKLLQEIDNQESEVFMASDEEGNEITLFDFLEIEEGFNTIILYREN